LDGSNGEKNALINRSVSREAALPEDVTKEGVTSTSGRFST